jgi:hypothetical protein
MRPRLLFLLSLPRSGSTLVQRVLAAHSDISTASEPWLLLPQLYVLRAKGIYAEYNHLLATRAIRDFVGEFPGGVEDYFKELRQFLLRLYGRASREQTTYFLDKTPRYHLVVHDIIRLFPDAKLLIVWRNPLAIVASIVDTWSGGKWSVHRWRVDLFDGLANLVSACESYSDRLYAVRYEDLIGQPMAAWPPMFDFLEVPFDPEVLSRFQSIRLTGRMGDPTGSVRYGMISTEPITKWKRTLATAFRKSWCRRYLHWIGEDRLAVMGYDLRDLLSQLEGIPSSPRLIASDVFRAVSGRAVVAWRTAAYPEVASTERW